MNAARPPAGGRPVPGMARNRLSAVLLRRSLLAMALVLLGLGLLGRARWDRACLRLSDRPEPSRLPSPPSTTRQRSCPRRGLPPLRGGARLARGAGPRVPATAHRAVRGLERRGQPRAAGRYATELGFEPTGVPVTIVGDRVWIGFSQPIAGEIEATVAAALAADPTTSTTPSAPPTSNEPPQPGEGEAQPAPATPNAVSSCRWSGQWPWEARRYSSAPCSSGSPMGSTRARCGSWRCCWPSCCTAGREGAWPWSARRSCS